LNNVKVCYEVEKLSLVHLEVVLRSCRNYSSHVDFIGRESIDVALEENFIYLESTCSAVKFTSLLSGAAGTHNDMTLLGIRAAYDFMA
jgi:hypothetical protein